MFTTDYQTFQTTPNWNKKVLTRSKDLLENLCLNLLCDDIFLSLHGQSDIPCITGANFDLGDYH